MTNIEFIRELRKRSNELKGVLFSDRIYIVPEKHLVETPFTILDLAADRIEKLEKELNILKDSSVSKLDKVRTSLRCFENDFKEEGKDG